MIPVSKTIQRKVMTARGQQLVVAIAPEGIYTREPRKRRAYLLPWGHAHLMGAKLVADATRLAKVQSRKSKRKAVAK